MSRPPAFQFYAKDWLASSRRQLMSRGARADYLDLLCWQSQDGGLPADPERIRLLLDRNPDEWQAAWAELEPCFPVDKDGLRRNHRLASVVTEADAYHQHKREAGSKGGTARVAKLKQEASKLQAEYETAASSKRQADLKPASASASAKQRTQGEALGVGTGSGADREPAASPLGTIASDRESQKQTPPPNSALSDEVQRQVERLGQRQTFAARRA